MQSDANPQARRRARTAERLREALARLLRDGTRRPTVAALAREAGVARNAIYANHRTILDELRQAATRHGADSEGESDFDRGREHRRVIGELKNQLQQLATQNAALLKRALDAEANAARARPPDRTVDPRDRRDASAGPAAHQRGDLRQTPQLTRHSERPSRWQRVRHGAVCHSCDQRAQH